MLFKDGRLLVHKDHTGTVAGFLCVTMPLECKRAAHTIFMRVLTSETLSGHVVSGICTTLITVEALII
jgi:hypothetical protein